TAKGTVFPQPLQATVMDSSGRPIQGVKVTFTLPATGARGTFPAGARTAVVTTDLNGIAISPAITANTTLGGWTATATAAGVTGSASYSLTNQ
ncbi:MAG TPA: hypothetical protein VMQ50_02780, partial [Casimicrobiaceae bacterium]|nr:hypothetical protein [Casimicrobiaceae bacterium]